MPMRKKSGFVRVGRRRSPSAADFGKKLAEAGYCPDHRTGVSYPVGLNLD
jgi:hypothetical protein